ncbi:MAG: glycerophosphoryl diester phosphodiesterase membrane domain-containing protein, partial [Dorea sp.]|nr:glycerophosphoryl diester phosphodiesterase membrane domain-containing protein [Dorea sp.]
MKKICNYLKFNLGTFLWFETGFRLLLFFLFVAGGGRIVDILLRFQSYSYVTQNNYKKFLCHPVSVIGFLFAGMIILLLILFEVAGLFLLYDAGRKQERIKLGDLWLAAFRTVERFIRRYPFSWYIYILLCLPNIYLQLILWEAERARFLVIVVKDITDVIGIPAFVILLVIYLVSSMMISLALPFRLFGNEKAFGKKLIFHEVLGKNYLNHLHTCFTTHVNVLICSAAAFMSVVLICIHMIWT